MTVAALAVIQAQVVECRRCPRLRAYCGEVALVRRRAFATETYWGRPVPAFGDADARIMLVGLAPAAHGANRTGRMFTGDRSGDFLFAALHRAGLASQPESNTADDGMRLHDVWMSAAARCAPPGNKPLPEEFARCRPFLGEEMRALPRLCAVIALGRLAHDQLLALWVAEGRIARRATYPFAHGGEATLPDGLHLLGSYHPSQQNTFTGRLTAEMLDAVLERARALAAQSTRAGAVNGRNAWR
ncbi:MAG: uracil-DNA glycosylase [Terriglobales bacterium]